jgi:hypothetical protein
MLPALERYDGPSFRVLRKYLRQEPSAESCLHIYVLSAKFGLINVQKPIGVYDQLMTPQRASQLKHEITRQVRELILPHNYSEIFLSMGKNYLMALGDMGQVVGSGTRVKVAAGGSGRKLTELKSWLSGKVPPPPSSSPEPEATGAQSTAQTVVLRGSTVKMTPLEAIRFLQLGIQQEPNSARKLHSWYVNVSGDKIGPKWAAAYLFQVPVSQFSADEARRALRGLGLTCYRL